MNPKQKLKMKISERVELFISDWRKDLTSRGFSEEYKDLHEQFAKLSAENTRLKMACKNKDEYKERLLEQEKTLQSILGKHGNDDKDNEDLDNCLKSLKTTKISLGNCNERVHKYSNLGNDLVDLYSNDNKTNVKYAYVGVTGKPRLMRLLPESTKGDGNCFWYTIVKSMNEGRKGSYFDELSLRVVLNDWVQKYQVETGSFLGEDEYGNIFDVPFFRWITLKTFLNIKETSMEEMKMFLLSHSTVNNEPIDTDIDTSVQKELKNIEKNIKTMGQWMYGRIPTFLYLALDRLVTICVFSPEQFTDNISVKNFLNVLTIYRGFGLENDDDIKSMIFVNYVGNNHYETMPRLDNSTRSIYITVNDSTNTYVPI